MYPLRHRHYAVRGGVTCKLTLAYYYIHSDAVVSPILAGDGMKVKTAEAIMYGKPIFATDEALEGYEVSQLKKIFRCNTSQEFITAINAYAGKPPYFPFNQEIRSLFLEKYHTSCYIKPFKEALLRIPDKKDA